VLGVKAGRGTPLDEAPVEATGSARPPTKAEPALEWGVTRPRPGKRTAHLYLRATKQFARGAGEGQPRGRTTPLAHLAAVNQSGRAHAPPAAVPMRLGAVWPLPKLSNGRFAVSPAGRTPLLTAMGPASGPTSWQPLSRGLRPRRRPPTAPGAEFTERADGRTTLPPEVATHLRSYLADCCGRSTRLAGEWHERAADMVPATWRPRRVLRHEGGLTDPVRRISTPCGQNLHSLDKKRGDLEKRVDAARRHSDPK